MRTSNERVERINEKVKEQKAVKRKKAITLSSVFGGVMVLILVFNLVLFVPFTVGDYDISMYKGSEYYELMSTIGKLTYRKYTTNNFHQWGLDRFFGRVVDSDFIFYPSQAPNIWGESVDSPAATPDASGGSTSNGSSSSSGEKYEEVTNNQVAGVTEGDLFKRSSEYIYYLDWRTGYYDYTEVGGFYYKDNYIPAHYILRTYHFEGENLELVSELDIFTTNDDMWMRDRGEIYLSEDCNTVTVILQEAQGARLYTTVVSVDVSNTKHPQETGRKSVSGTYVSSRMTNGLLLLVTNFTVWANPDFANQSEYLPQVGDMDNLESIPMKDIMLPDDATSAQYSIITSFDGDTLALKDAVALFSFTTTLYVSENHLFATREKVEEMELECIPETVEGDKYQSYHVNYTINNTEIACVAYDNNGLDIRGSITATGTVVNQYSLDEYEGVLRVFTTSNKRARSLSSNIYDMNILPNNFNTDECNLYCYNLDTFEMIAQVENFSDPAESVKSVRFDGNTAYVCTAVVDYSWQGIFWACDPVFEFDLSDYNNITSTDTGTIPGYSLSLTRFVDDTLIGIGYGDDSLTLKIELYRANGETVDCVSKYEMFDCEFATEFKACFIDAEHGLVGLGVEYFDSANGGWTTRYLLLRYDGELFEEVGFFDFELMSKNDFFTGVLNDMRACYVDGFMYIFCDSRANAIYVG